MFQIGENPRLGFRPIQVFRGIGLRPELPGVRFGIKAGYLFELFQRISSFHLRLKSVRPTPGSPIEEFGDDPTPTDKKHVIPAIFWRESIFAIRLGL